MKTIHWLAGSLILALFSCRSEAPSSERNIDFGNYETLDPVQLPASIKQRLQELQFQVPNSPQNPFTGYTSQNDQTWRDSLSTVGADEGIRIAMIAVPSHSEEGPYAVVALRNPFSIGLSDIREAIGETDRVVIRMTMQGAKKWADMTERNTGRQVAFLLEGQIYNLPLVAAPILSDEALITGLDAAEARRIAGMLNGDARQ